jgi:hypothetical protein
MRSVKTEARRLWIGIEKAKEGWEDPQPILGMVRKHRQGSRRSPGERDQRDISMAWKPYLEFFQKLTSRLRCQRMPQRVQSRLFRRAAISQVSFLVVCFTKLTAKRGPSQIDASSDSVPSQIGTTSFEQCAIVNTSRILCGCNLLSRSCLLRNSRGPPPSSAVSSDGAV